jgi:hypothetical protein
MVKERNQMPDMNTSTMSEETRSAEPSLEERIDRVRQLVTLIRAAVNIPDDAVIDPDAALSAIAFAAYEAELELDALKALPGEIANFYPPKKSRSERTRSQER